LQLIVQILDTAFLSLFLGGLGTTYDVHLGLIGKRVVNFLLVLIIVVKFELYELYFWLELYEL